MIRESNSNSTAYSDARQQEYYDLEEVSWWFLHRADIIEILADRFFDRKHAVCDIGGSNGFNSKRLQDSGYDVILVEPTGIACKNAKQRGVKNVVNSTFQEYSGQIEQFICLDVIEHIEDDTSFVQQLSSRISEDKRGIISVPAFRILWSSEDVVDGHFRRYGYDELFVLLKNSGFEIEYIGYCFKFLWIPVFIRRHLMEILGLKRKVQDRSEEEKRKVDEEQFLRPTGIAGSLLDLFMSAERKRLTAGKRISYGTTLLAVVKKSKA